MLVIGNWIFYNYFREEEGDSKNETKYFQQCPYCTHLFFDYADEPLKICPNCKSYIIDLPKRTYI